MVTLITSAEANPKQKKLAYELGICAGMVYLLPHMIVPDGANLCAAADSCAVYQDEDGEKKTNCFYDAGRGSMPAAWLARAARRALFVEDRPAFMRQLAEEIGILEGRARRQGRTPVVRLNGLSDIPWETIAADGAPSIFARFPEVKFYDYTKIVARLSRPLPNNYHLTFSLSAHNDRQAARAMALGYNVAVVFRTAEYPSVWAGRPVIDGDAHDFRHLDPAGVVVGLKAKGSAKKDTSGFVREVDSVGLDLTRVPRVARADGTQILMRDTPASMAAD